MTKTKTERFTQQRMRNSDELYAFRSKARKMKPTQNHRAALWENMLGTVYAMNPEGEVRYFDYDYTGAMRFIGPVGDIRVARRTGGERLGATKYEDYELPRRGQVVWFVRDVVDGRIG